MQFVVEIIISQGMHGRGGKVCTFGPLPTRYNVIEKLEPVDWIDEWSTAIQRIPALFRSNHPASDWTKFGTNYLQNILGNTTISVEHSVRRTFAYNTWKPLANIPRVLESVQFSRDGEIEMPFSAFVSDIRTGNSPRWLYATESLGNAKFSSFLKEIGESSLSSLEKQVRKRRVSENLPKSSNIKSTPNILMGGRGVVINTHFDASHNFLVQV